MIRIEYYYKHDILKAHEEANRHQRIYDLLVALKANGSIGDFVAQEAEVAFPDPDTKRMLFDQLRDFATRHKVGLARVFGSNRAGFWYMPAEFILVFRDGGLAEVFPCRIAGSEVDPLEYLQTRASGQPWTTRSGHRREGKLHAMLITQIADDPSILEAGLVLESKSVQVSRDFGESGYVDLVFRDRDGRFLLVEVKAKPDELDKAIGQILRYGQLYAQQNQMLQSSLRLGIACPYIPVHYRSILEKVGIACYEVRGGLTEVPVQMSGQPLLEKGGSMERNG